MSKVYFTSDPHLGHSNLCKSLRHMTSDESDKLIIDNWNSIVTKRDIVYIMGDLTMENPKQLHKLLYLKGDIRVIGGNHDNYKVCKLLNQMGIITMGCLEYKEYICTHIPVHPVELMRFKGNIHGHIHLPGEFKYDEEGNEVNWKYTPPNILDDRYINVNVEFHNYKPVLFEELICK